MINRRMAWLCILVVVSLATGCGASGAFKKGTYENPLYGYQLKESNSQLLGPDWKLDNYQLDTQGSPTRLKDGEEVKVLLDIDGDGTLERNTKHPDPDLRFKHLEHDGVIWVRSVPLNADAARKNLKVLTHGWVSSLAGSGKLSLYSDELGVSVSQEKGYAARVLGEADGQLSGHEAYFARVQLSSLEQLKVDPSHVESLMEIAVVRTDYVWSASQRGVFPVYLLIGYSNHPEFFEAGLGAFRKLVGALQLTPPPGIPEEVIERCKLGERPMHLVRSSNLGNLGSDYAALEGPSPELKCLSDALKKYAPPKEVGSTRERMLVYRSGRQGADTRIPVLDNQAADAESEPSEAAPATPNEVAPTPSEAASEESAPTPPEGGNG